MITELSLRERGSVARYRTSQSKLVKFDSDNSSLCSAIMQRLQDFHSADFKLFVLGETSEETPKAVIDLIVSRAVHRYSADIGKQLDAAEAEALACVRNRLMQLEKAKTPDLSGKLYVDTLAQLQASNLRIIEIQASLDRLGKRSALITSSVNLEKFERFHRRGAQINILRGVRSKYSDDAKSVFLSISRSVAVSEEQMRDSEISVRETQEELANLPTPNAALLAHAALIYELQHARADINQLEMDLNESSKELSATSAKIMSSCEKFFRVWGWEWHPKRVNSGELQSIDEFLSRLVTLEQELAVVQGGLSRLQDKRAPLQQSYDDLVSTLSALKSVTHRNFDTQEIRKLIAELPSNKKRLTDIQELAAKKHAALSQLSSVIASARQENGGQLPTALKQFEIWPPAAIRTLEPSELEKSTLQQLNQQSFSISEHANVLQTEIGYLQREREGVIAGIAHTKLGLAGLPTPAHVFTPVELDSATDAIRVLEEESYGYQSLMRKLQELGAQQNVDVANSSLPGLDVRKLTNQWLQEFRHLAQAFYTSQESHNADMKLMELASRALRAQLSKATASSSETVPGLIKQIEDTERILEKRTAQHQNQVHQMLRHLQLVGITTWTDPAVLEKVLANMCSSQEAITELNEKKVDAIERCKSAFVQACKCLKLPLSQVEKAHALENLRTILDVRRKEFDQNQHYQFMSDRLTAQNETLNDLNATIGHKEATSAEMAKMLAFINQQRSQWLNSRGLVSFESAETVLDRCVEASLIIIQLDRTEQELDTTIRDKDRFEQRAKHYLELPSTNSADISTELQMAERECADRDAVREKLAVTEEELHTVVSNLRDVESEITKCQDKATELEETRSRILNKLPADMHEGVGQISRSSANSGNFFTGLHQIQSAVRDYEYALEEHRKLQNEMTDTMEDIVRDLSWYPDLLGEGEPTKVIDRLVREFEEAISKSLEVDRCADDERQYGCPLGVALSHYPENHECRPPANGSN